MFRTVFFFEIGQRLRRPAVYIYFAAAFIFTVGSFSTGSLPVGEKEFINAPFLIAFWSAAITLMMMLVSSSVMGSAIYRDIEYNTTDYYLTYPVTKAGYFWGRFLGSFAMMVLIALAIPLGVRFGSWLGPLMGWKDSAAYGPNHLMFYLHPFLVFALPNIFFTSAFFFGLVAITRNVKVIYTGGILLFLGYFISIFFLKHSNDSTVINISDPFGVNAIRMLSDFANSQQKNTTLFPVEGSFLVNRLLWPGIGLLVLVYTYFRFNFEKFFSGKRDKAAIDEVTVLRPGRQPAKPGISFAGTYNRSTFGSLLSLELRNILRDNYFWIITTIGMLFLGFVFWVGDQQYGVSNLPRTVTLFNTFNEAFPFFIFFIIIFYTGESLHRDRITRYAFINDSLPPANRLMNASKLVALLIMATGLAVLPVIVALVVQVAKGYFTFNLPGYFDWFFVVEWPGFLEMVFFAYAVHVFINNKFAAHGIGIVFWVGIYLLRGTGTFDYNLFLYSQTPTFGLTDMDGMGHMARAVNWFTAYWLLSAGFLVVLAALFYHRGVTTSFRERWKLARSRFDRRTQLLAIATGLCFLPVAGYIYYNVSYLNSYLTKGETDQRGILYEKTLKHFQRDPLPKVVRIKMTADLFPAEQRESVHAFVTIVNKTDTPIAQMLVDGGELSTFFIRRDGRPLAFTCPLLYPRGGLNWFRTKKDSSEYRLYTLADPLAPGDSAVLEIGTEVFYRGFQNMMYARNLLRNGIFFNGGLPSLGYDDDEEISSPYVRKKNGLPVREEIEIAPDDAGRSNLKSGRNVDLLDLDLVVSTAGDQTVVAAGTLLNEWQKEGRNYFHFVSGNRGLYIPFGIVSARLKTKRDTVRLDRPVGVSVYYHPGHERNVDRFMAACQDGLKYYSAAWGPYPFDALRVVETSGFSPRNASLPTMTTYAEWYSWHAGFTDSAQFDYLYFNTARELAQQWWRYAVAPNNTVGSLDISEGLAGYGSLVMMSRKYGELAMKPVLQDQLWYYLFVRRRLEEKEHPVLRSNDWFEWGGKMSMIMYTLRDLIGEDSVNAALRELSAAFAFRNKPPYAGSYDLYHCLQKHTPDSLQYYLRDCFEQVTMYDNKVVSATSVPTGRPNEFAVTITVDVAKTWLDAKGEDAPAAKVNDLIEIGVFAEPQQMKTGLSRANPLYLQRFRLTAGLHTFHLVVQGKPITVGIDPLAKLIDRQPQDNMKKL